MVVFSFGLVYRAEHTHRDKLEALRKVESEVTSVDLPPGYDCLVHVTGTLRIAEAGEGGAAEDGNEAGEGGRGGEGAPAADASIDLTSALPPGFRPVILKRKSSMLQWVEEKVSSFDSDKKNNKDGDSSSNDRVTYSKKWLPRVQSSKFYRDSIFYKNPKVMPIKSAVFVASSIGLGPFRIEADLAEQVPCIDNGYLFRNLDAPLPPVRLDDSLDGESVAMFGRKTAFIRSGNEVELVSSKGWNSIGDMRFKYSAVQSGQNMYSLICHVTADGTLVSRHSFYDRQAMERPIIFPGALSVPDMLSRQRDLDDSSLHEAMIASVLGNALGAAFLHDPMRQLMTSKPDAFRSLPRFVVGFGLSLSLSSIIFAKL
jgi:hypothetical protein